MKKIYIYILSFLSIILLLNVQIDLQASNSLSSSGIPYETYTLGEYGKLTQTQTAYIPVGVMAHDLGLNAPADIYYHNDNFYIADTGNRRILVLDSEAQLVKSIALAEFDSPMGVFANDEYLFVADQNARTVFKIDINTEEIVQRIIRPTSPIFGQSNLFQPTKVVVGSNDSIYVVGEGSTSGIIQFNYAGEFVGYLGINTVPLSLRKIIYNFFVKDSKLASSLPPAPTNIALGQKGSILTTNSNVKETFKRLNISGINTLYTNTIYPTANLTDIWMNDENYIYMVASTGEVYEYDSNGNLLFHFNTRDTTLKQTLGLTSNPTGVVVDRSGSLYILDKNYNNIQIYQRTVFVELVHQAVTLYNDGQYIQSKPLWEEILRENSSFALAHSALGTALTKEGKYEEALQEFHAAKDKLGYSNAYWEIRNVRIQKNLSRLALILIIGILLLKILFKVFRASKSYSTYEEKVIKFKEKKFFSELTLTTKMIKRPHDVIYFVKKKNQGSYLSAFTVLIMFILVYLINTYTTAFIFRNEQLGNVFSQFILVLGLFSLFIIMNFLVSTFSDGEGRFKDVFIISCYALIPFILFTLPMTLISHVLTYNESFIYYTYHQIIGGWTIFLLLYSVKEVHNYTFWETVKSILLIVFGIFVVIIMGLLIYSFIGQLLDFVVSIIKEVRYRV